MRGVMQSDNPVFLDSGRWWSELEWIINESLDGLEIAQVTLPPLTMLSDIPIRTDPAEANRDMIAFGTGILFTPTSADTERTALTVETVRQLHELLTEQ